MQEILCKTCKFFKQHYILNRRRLVETASWHCLRIPGVRLINFRKDCKLWQADTSMRKDIEKDIEKDISNNIKIIKKHLSDILQYLKAISQ